MTGRSVTFRARPGQEPGHGSPTVAVHVAEGHHQPARMFAVLTRGQSDRRPSWRVSDRPQDAPALRTLRQIGAQVTICYRSDDPSVRDAGYARNRALLGPASRLLVFAGPEPSPVTDHLILSAARRSVPTTLVEPSGALHDGEPASIHSPGRDEHEDAPCRCERDEPSVALLSIADRFLRQSQIDALYRIDDGTGPRLVPMLDHWPPEARAALYAVATEHGFTYHVGAGCRPSAHGLLRHCAAVAASCPAAVCFPRLTADAWYGRDTVTSLDADSLDAGDDQVFRSMREPMIASAGSDPFTAAVLADRGYLPSASRVRAFDTETAPTDVQAFSRLPQETQLRALIAGELADRLIDTRPDANPALEAMIDTLAARGQLASLLGRIRSLDDLALPAAARVLRTFAQGETVGGEGRLTA